MNIVFRQEDHMSCLWTEPMFIKNHPEGVTRRNVYRQRKNI